MANDEFREAQQQARGAGLAARHEKRLEAATYTAAEVKVLTEAALRLGRKEAGEEIANAIGAYDQEWSANSWRRIAARIAVDLTRGTHEQ